MKKFYTFALATFVALTATAQKAQLASSAIESGKSTFTKSLAIRAAQSDSRMQAPSKAAGEMTLANYSGTYSYTWTNLLNGNYPPAELVVTVDETTGAAVISGFPQNYSINATFDLQAGTLSIPNMQNLGPDSYGDANWFYLKPVTQSGNMGDGASDAAASVGTINGNTITFPALDIWAIGDPSNEKLGWWMLTYNNIMELQEAEDPGADPNEGWTSKGNATFQDGWVLTCLGVDQTEQSNWYEVELQQNDENPSLYRLVNPYKGNFPYVGYNSSKNTGYIQFNISDPYHVTFDIVDAAFANSQVGISKMYCYNTLSYFMVANPGFTAADIVGILGDQIPYSTYNEGVVTVPSSLVDGKWSNDACFGIQGEIDGGYGWNDADGNSVNMEAKIFFPGALTAIRDITTDATLAPARYYNLQGVEISDPAAGQIVICVRGDKATKIVVR